MRRLRGWRRMLTLMLTRLKPRRRRWRTLFSPSLQSSTRVKEVPLRVKMVVKRMMSSRTNSEINSSLFLTNLCPTSTKTLEPQLREVVGDCQDDHEVIKKRGVSFSKAVSPKLDPLSI